MITFCGLLLSNAARIVSADLRRVSSHECGVSQAECGVATNSDGRWMVRGTTVDDGPVRRVLVNGSEARRLAPEFLEWEADLDPQRTGVQHRLETVR